MCVVVQDDSESTFVYNDVSYSVGDFVYVEPLGGSEAVALEHHLVLVEKLWKNSSAQLMLTGTFFLQPQETFHHATRKFLQRVSHVSHQSTNSSSYI